ncbi:MULTISPECIES: biliverdin-producing heme oxygenase [Methylobacterium]|uniref:Bacteriophytochrome heme oxygenase BphO n=1 Tax=Methylobacterium oryzae CBMB20 TaxID=693986 RepID=A0A089P1U3_9HYPH|nr:MULTISPECIES: biliverdin-producing heme oxygenase [Methylobacterium]MDH3029022.1 biliverdin-producing heme oxygenase [Methylobacterium fujisawaense]AIQ92003.1 Bacteriophytochrome heme oxygenase BphO [Methylobacterium oryzae CBMB20]AWV16290.1 heme oxygenase [Methylobacterium sp. XJLW]MBP28867.1 biliverdin-producing heme oxygenase [Methylobacterium sp.]MDE4911721.1 biliverdin-producing heme oxygenase [Methylobacterium sp. 092160098-2]
MRTRDGLHARLRAATDPAHRALEASLDWQARVATLSGYRNLLGRLYGFHAVWESAIGSGLADEVFLAPRRRLTRLAADLDHLGLTPSAVAALPRPTSLVFDGPAAAMGALYVLEGSTLGGQLIGRHIAGLHGFSGDGLAYYRAHGPAAGAMWAAFRTRLEIFGEDPAAEAALTGAAVSTFSAMGAWLGPGPETPVAA